MCRLLRVPRSSFYAWVNRVETPTQGRRRVLAVEVTKEFGASRQTSGCRRIAAALNRRGIECSVGMVADLMRELGLAAVLQAHHRAGQGAGGGAGPDRTDAVDPPKPTDACRPYPHRPPGRLSPSREWCRRRCASRRLQFTWASAFAEDGDA